MRFSKTDTLPTFLPRYTFAHLVLLCFRNSRHSCAHHHPKRELEIEVGI